MLVDSGASGHYFDDAIIPRLRNKFDRYQVLDVPRKITTDGEGQLDGVAKGLLINVVVDSALDELSRPWSDACLPTAGYCGFSGGR